MAVGSENKTVSLSDDDFTQAKRVMGKGDIPMITVDSLGLKIRDKIPQQIFKNLTLIFLTFIGLLVLYKNLQ